MVGAGFAGVGCVRRLERELAAAEADVTLVTPFAYQLYLPLLPQVASGVLTPQSIAVSLRRSRKYRTRIIPGGAVGVDLASKVCVVRTITDEIVNEPYDYIVLAPGSVTRTFDIPGLTDHAFGMKTLAEAAYIRDHVITQLDLADASHDPAERASRLRFVVVGGGYAGTETAACLQLLTHNAVKRYPRLDPGLIKWHLIDIAPKLMPELGDKLGRSAQEVLRKRGSRSRWACPSRRLARRRSPSPTGGSSRPGPSSGRRASWRARSSRRSARRRSAGGSRSKRS